MCLIVRRPPHSPWPISPAGFIAQPNLPAQRSARTPGTLPETQEGTARVAYHGSAVRTRICLAFTGRLRRPPARPPDARSNPFSEAIPLAARLVVAEQRKPAQGLI